MISERLCNDFFDFVVGKHFFCANTLPVQTQVNACVRVCAHVTTRAP